MPSRADSELVRRGLARSRRQATAFVAEGRVLVDGTVVTKASARVGDDDRLTVTPDPDDPGYASRAGGKLAGALDALSRQPAGRALTDRLAGARCLDLGASTGGFTDVLLRRGASHVVAMDVGHDQLVDALRSDPRVTVVEGFNVRDLTPDDLPVPPDVVVGDLSFISLRLVLGPVAASVPPGADLLLLVKPQFEVGRDRLGSGGVVRDPSLHAAAVTDVVTAAAGHGLVPRAVVPSPVPGPSGNREFFVWLRRSAEVATADDGAVRQAADRSAAWEPDGQLPPVIAVARPGTGGER
ncbi:TlyA family RNA methyltransferase [Isoptericola sp. 178]|uniref:TlyA family RNA methyltransferase n=1 Tax=Isoptericola sp. 178 TaxID=3064651 RepID=UPI002713711F|nr:TlyA family RNA methyltransferase [Isoptericola sp. 178]MDO8144727.1 TlyA family RNA methyltransferase [Isoptericola sp. 178]